MELNYKKAGIIHNIVETKLNEVLYDAIILSSAGINSLGLTQKISQIFSTSEIIPSAGQGVVALQCRDDDEGIDVLLCITKIECINDHADIRGVLAGLAHMRDLDQFERRFVYL